MGIDKEIIIILLPISILLAIALSPESLHTLTANSAKNAIPVIFNKSNRNSLFILALSDIDFSKSNIPVNLSITKNNIKTPAINDMYIANSGLYCLIITIIISATRPNSNYFYNIIHMYLSTIQKLFSLYQINY